MFPARNNNSSSKLITDLDYSGHDSGLDTPPSTANRPSSYRRPLPAEPNNHHNEASSRDSSETSASSSRGTMLNSPVGSFRAKHLHQMSSNLNRVNDLHGSRQSVQERILKLRNDEERCASIKSNNRVNQTEMFDNNLNPFYKSNGNQSPRASLTPQHTPVKSKHLHAHPQMNGGYGNNNGSLNSNARNGTAIFRERCQHPAVAAIMNGA